LPPRRERLVLTSGLRAPVAGIIIIALATVMILHALWARLYP
jgi:hypothetical protein